LAFKWLCLALVGGLVSARLLRLGLLLALAKWLGYWLLASAIGLAVAKWLRLGLALAWLQLLAMAEWL